MEARYSTLVHSSASLIFLVDKRCVLLAPTVLLCHQSNCLQSAVAAAQFLNSLPDDIVLADSLLTFRCQLKHYLFQQSYPDVIL